ncbi:MAG: LEA type 2 family protein, partial [Gemmatimonadota bacterium]
STVVAAVKAADLAAACVPRVTQPDLRLEGARHVSLGLRGGVVDVELSVYNPNDFGLRTSGLTYDLDLEEPGGDGWFDFTEGRVERALEVPPGDTASVVIPVEFDYQGLGRAIRSLIDRGTFDYRVSGTVALDGPVQRAIRYRHNGSVTPDGVR